MSQFPSTDIRSLFFPSELQEKHVVPVEQTDSFIDHTFIYSFASPGISILISLSLLMLTLLFNIRKIMISASCEYQE